LSSILQGLSGLALGYAAVEAPFAMTLLRRRAGIGKVVSSSILAFPLTVVAGITTMVAAPLLHAVGVSRGSFLELAAGVGVSVGVGYAAARLLGRPPAPNNSHRRGTVVEGGDVGPARERATVSANRREQTLSFGRDEPRNADRRQTDRGQAGSGHAQLRLPRITLAGLPVEVLDETKHFKIIGTTGTGKSTAIRELMGGALARGDRVIFADPDGGYLARFKDDSREDVILNPFDPASHKWDLFGEIGNPYDIDQLARSLLPDPGGPD
jgi:hypothetical protein